MFRRRNLTIESDVIELGAINHVLIPAYLLT